MIQTYDLRLSRAAANIFVLIMSLSLMACGGSKTPEPIDKPVVKVTPLKPAKLPEPKPAPKLNDGKPQRNLAVVPMFIGDKRVEVEIADTDYSRQVGMMWRKSQPQDAGMLFIYPTKRQLSFWMKNCYIGLDIAFINDDGTIAEIRQMEPGFDQERPPSTFANGQYRYALEMNKFWFKTNKIEVGAYIDGVLQLNDR